MQSNPNNDYFVPHFGPHQLARITLLVDSGEVCVEVEPIIAWQIETKHGFGDTWLEPRPVTPTGAHVPEDGFATFNRGYFVHPDGDTVEVVALWDAGRDTYLLGESPDYTLDEITAKLRSRIEQHNRRQSIEKG
tara:strand:- start:3693 stop:4094 length:402 start_codon:yes stop_codon:yes gene_type:complete